MCHILVSCTNLEALLTPFIEGFWNRCFAFQKNGKTRHSKCHSTNRSLLERKSLESQQNQQFYKAQLNPLPIVDFPMVPVRVDGGYTYTGRGIKPWAVHASIHGNSESWNHQPEIITLKPWHWSQYLPIQYLPNPSMREGVWKKSTTNVRFGAQNKLHNLTQLECTTHAVQETLYVASWRMVPWLPLTSIGLILTSPKLHLATFK